MNYERPATTGGALGKAVEASALSIPPAIDNDRSPLRQALDAAIAEAKSNGSKLSMKGLTVMSEDKDPFRLDTSANHRDSKWLADRIADLAITGRIHLRGLRYAISMAPTPFIKPDGTRYVNDNLNWGWLSDVAMKAARWLGYIPWDRIFDKRNAEPFIYEARKPDPWGYLSIGLNIEIPNVDQIEPDVGLADFHGVQPYKIVMIGEKASLHDILLPIAEQHGADLYLPTGDISDPMVYRVAKNAAEDGRPLVVLYFSDCDPSGWNMPIVVARKLQAFKATLFPDLEFRQYRAGLTPDQVREFELPEAPLKESEKRASKWRELMEVEQTEIDALVQLRPDLLRRIAREAIAPFYDRTLGQRVREAREAWEQQAQRIVDENLGDHLDRVRAGAAAKLEELQAEVEAINDALRFDIGDFDVPDVPEVPEPVISEDQPLGLVDSRWSFVDQCQALTDSRGYRS